jgi:glycosyltransferase involved in cell wall biosynthesis
VGSSARRPADDSTFRQFLTARPRATAPMPRVLVVAYHFPPIGGGGVQRNAKFVRYLPEFGYRPVVVTGAGGATGRWTPVDTSLNASVTSQTEVHRVTEPEPPVSEGLRSKLEHHVMLHSPFRRWWRRGVLDSGLSAGHDCDLVYGSIVPYHSADAVARLAQALGKPWVADLQDPWALDEVWSYPTELHRRIELAQMRKLLGKADAVVMNTPEAMERVRRAFPELRSRLVVSIPNGFDAADFASDQPRRTDRTFRIVHAGYLHTDEGLRLRDMSRARKLLGGRYLAADMLTRSHVYLLEALGLAIDADPSLAQTVEVVLAGVVNDTDRRIASEARVSVQLPGYVDHTDTVALLRSADLLFLPMHDLPPGTRAGLVPGKTYEYLAARVPILAAVPDGDARELLGAAGNTVLCRPSDTEAMAKAIAAEVERWRAGEPPPPPDEVVLARYERRHLTEQLAGVFDSVLGRSP